MKRAPDAGVASALRFAGAGFTFLASAGLMAFLGRLADRWFGTGPVLLLAGTLLGVAVATYGLLREVMRMDRRSEGARPQDRRGGCPDPDPGDRNDRDRES